MTLDEIVYKVSTTLLCENVYVDLEGIIHPTKVKMPRKGLWYFDGQIFYQPNPHKEKL